MADGDFELIDSIDENGTSELLISGNLSIDNAGAIHSHFLKNCIEPDDLHLKFEKVETIDISIIQLIIALIINRKTNSKNTETSFNIDSVSKDLLINTGVLNLIESITKNKT